MSAKGLLAPHVQCKCGGRVRITNLDAGTNDQGQIIGAVESGHCVECGREGTHFADPHGPNRLTGNFSPRIEP
jgi:hypothetical protein